MSINIPAAVFQLDMQHFQVFSTARHAHWPCEFCLSVFAVELVSFAISMLVLQTMNLDFYCFDLFFSLYMVVRCNTSSISPSLVNVNVDRIGYIVIT